MNFLELFKYTNNGDNMKKLEIFLDSLFTFLLCFLTHFIYKWLPCNFIALFFPVNESIWEHMKMIYTTILLYSLIKYLLSKKFNNLNNNSLFIVVLKSIICIPIFLIIYLPIFSIIGENMIVNFIVLFISLLITNIIGNYLEKYNFKINKIYSLIIIIIVYIFMGILTFNPPKNFLFYDSQTNSYGINKQKS